MTPVPRPLRSALIDAMGGWGPYTLREIDQLFEEHDFYAKTDVEPEQGDRRTLAAEYLACIDWDKPAERKRLLALIDDVLIHYPADVEERIGGRLRRVLKRTLEASGSPADAAHADVFETLDAEHVNESWQKALDRRHGDPEGAITAARTTLESVCKLILDDVQGGKYEPTDDLPALYRKVAKALKMAPEDHLEQAFKQILGGCSTVVNGLATLRNKLSDSHGQGAQPVRPSPRHANLAVNLAGTMGVFLVETWQARKPRAG